MHDIAYVVGWTVGAGLDPLAWGIAAVAAFAFTRFAWQWRLAGAVALNLALGAALVAARTPSLGPTDPAIFLFSAIATAIWFGMFIGVRSLFFRRRTAGGES